MFLASFVPAVHAQTIHVTTFADNVPGSLRAAITQANSSCTTIPCTIVFDAPGTYDVNTTALPAITQASFGAVGDSAQGILAIKAVNSSPT
ncbi:MAG: hypothetical protein ACXW2X_12875, partial [Thermoanaerobaculia bacterium]